MNHEEFTVVLIKPDAIEEENMGRIITWLEEDFPGCIRDIHMLRFTSFQAQRFYPQHRTQDFFEPLIKFMTSGPILALRLQGNDIIADVRATVGDTDPERARKGTIRGEYGFELPRNAIHASDSSRAAQNEWQQILAVVHGEK